MRLFQRVQGIRKRFGSKTTLAQDCGESCCNYLFIVDDKNKRKFTSYQCATPFK